MKDGKFLFVSPRFYFTLPKAHTCDGNIVLSNHFIDAYVCIGLSQLDICYA